MYFCNFIVGADSSALRSVNVAKVSVSSAILGDDLWPESGTDLPIERRAVIDRQKNGKKTVKMVLKNF